MMMNFLLPPMGLFGCRKVVRRDRQLRVNSTAGAAGLGSVARMTAGGEHVVGQQAGTCVLPHRQIARQCVYSLLSETR